MDIKNALFKRFLMMGLDYLKEELPRLKRELCDFSDSYAERSDNEWDDIAAELLRSLLGVEKED